VNETAQSETSYVGIFWLVQTPKGDARLLAVGCPLNQAEPYGDCLTYGGRSGDVTGLSIPPCALAGQDVEDDVGGVDALRDRFGAGRFDRRQPVGEHRGEDVDHPRLPSSAPPSLRRTRCRLL